MRISRLVLVVVSVFVLAAVAAPGLAAASHGPGDGEGDMGAPAPSMPDEGDGDEEEFQDPVVVVIPISTGAILHICRRGDGRGDNTGLYWHLVTVDGDGVEGEDTPTTASCTEEHKILDPNPPLPASYVNDKGVQVKQAVTECRNGTLHTVTYDLTVSPRKEIGDKPSNVAC